MREARMVNGRYEGGEGGEGEYEGGEVQMREARTGIVADFKTGRCGHEDGEGRCEGGDEG